MIFVSLAWSRHGLVFVSHAQCVLKKIGRFGDNLCTTTQMRALVLNLLCVSNFFFFSFLFFFFFFLLFFFFLCVCARSRTLLSSRDANRVAITFCQFCCTCFFCNCLHFLSCLYFPCKVSVSCIYWCDPQFPVFGFSCFALDFCFLMAIHLQVLLSLSFDEDLRRPSSSEETHKHKKKRRRKNEKDINQLQDNDKKKNKQEMLAKTREEVSLSSNLFHFLMLLVFLNVFNKCLHR